MLASRYRAPDAPSRLRDPRITRQLHQHRKMGLALRDLIYSRPRTVALGHDLLIEKLMAAKGFGELDYFALQVGSNGRRITAIVVPTRLWRDEFSMSQVFEVKAQARSSRTKVLLLPERSVCNTVRSVVAKRIGCSKGVQYTDSQFKAVIDHIHEARITNLQECASAIANHQDPVGVVLALVARGFVDVDLSKPLDSSSWVTTPL